MTAPTQQERLSLRQQVGILAALAGPAFAFRFLPYTVEMHEGWMKHLWGATPVLTFFLLSVSKCRSYWVGMLIPMAGFVVSDIALEVMLAQKGWDTSSLRGRVIMYAIFLALSQFGLVLKYLRLSLPAKLTAAVGVSAFGSTLFFVLTNGLIWLASTPDQFPYYPKTWKGFIECYSLALPFYQNQMLLEPLFVVALFGGYELLAAQVAARAEARAELATA
jgi:hypothetical protein